VRLLSSLGPCNPLCEDVLAAIRTLAALPSGRRALLAAGAEAAVRTGAAAAAAAAGLPTPRCGGGGTAAAAAAGSARRAEAQRAGAVQAQAGAALQALTSPPAARLRESPRVLVSSLVLAPPKCSACGAAAPRGGGPLQKCSGCGGPERWCSKECQRASWVAGHRDACKERRAGGGG
jgi:hypothetical protein